MASTVHRGYFLLIFYFVWQTASLCRGPCQKLCGYNGDELNSTEIEHSFQEFCDCKEVTFCCIIEVSHDCSAALIKVHANNSFFSNMNSGVKSLELKEGTSHYEILKKTGNEFVLKVSTTSGNRSCKFISCEILGELRSINAREGFTPHTSQWEVISVTPPEVLVSTVVKVQLTVVKQNATIGTWCFVNTPDNNIEILQASWVSNTKVDCIGFKPKVPNFFTISIGSQIVSRIFNKGITIKVISKPPVAQVAEYSSDFETIFIHFDKNIELHSTCDNAFSEDTKYHFGDGFKCFVKGNLLMVQMGLYCQNIDTVVIDSGNNICEAGSGGSEFCLPAHPVRLTVLKPKLPGPSFSVYMNSTCSGSEAPKYVVKLMPFRTLKNDFNQSQISQTKSSGKMQRKNLIIWKKMREFQREIPPQAILQMNETDIFPQFENVDPLESLFNVDENISGSAARVSVLVQSSTVASTIVAEAEVKLCEVKLFRYKWLVNGKDVFEDGKLLILKGLAPGKYVIKSLIVAVNSTEILGQGWCTAEILQSEKKVFIVPLEVTVGTTDDIFLRAVTWNSNSVSWSCRTTQEKICLTTKQKLLNDVIDFNSLNITIPGGTLPVGGYIWTIADAGGSNTATVFVKSGNIPAIGVDVSPVHVKLSGFSLNGTIRRAQDNCRIWWSSDREMGFSYLQLNKTAEYSVEEKHAEPITLSVPSEMWKNAQPDSQYIFKLQVFCPQSTSNQEGSYDYIRVPVVFSNPPRVSPLTVEPQVGKAMITDFSVSGGEANASNDDQPLTFEWSYIDPCGVEVPIERGAFVKNFKTYLPPGEIKLIVRVCNWRNICSTAVSPLINVIQASEFPAENFRNARNQIEHLITSGNTLEAFGLSITVFKSLALLAETEVREEMFSTVEEGIKFKMEELTKRIQYDPKARELSLELLERASQVAKYFRKHSNILSLLTEFKRKVNSVEP